VVKNFHLKPSFYSAQQRAQRMQWLAEVQELVQDTFPRDIS
jgi:hypothetical protein